MFDITTDDLKAIYEHLRNRYPISLTSSFSMGFKSNIDFPILHGQSDLGRFNLFFDDVSFAFYAMRDDGEVFAHWHLQTLIEAEKTVADFMEGRMGL